MILQVGCKLVVSFNPSEKYFSNWQSSPSMRQWTSGLAFQSALLLREPAPRVVAHEAACQVERPDQSSTLWPNVSHEKKNALLSIDFWLFHRDPYFMVFIFNPHITGDRISSRKKT